MGLFVYYKHHEACNHIALIIRSIFWPEVPTRVGLMVGQELIKLRTLPTID